jgi:hypothetical protein
MKYCCQWFEVSHRSEKQIGLNIRIIKLSPEFVKRGYFGDNLYRYIITEGYTSFDDRVKRAFIEFCPYCGKELKKIYRSDEYVNETNHEY